MNKNQNSQNPNELLKRISKLEIENKNLKNYKTLYEQAPLPYHSLDDDGSILDVNPAWLSTLGYNKKNVISKPIKDFLHPDWHKVLDKNFPAFKNRGYVHDIHFRMKHKDNHYVDILLEGRIGYNPDGSFRQTYCVFKDISKEIDLERNLEKSITNYRNLIEHSNQMYYVHDTKHVLSYVSPKSTDILGFTPEEMKINWTTLVTDNPINEKGFKRTEKALKTGKIQKPYILELKKKDGEHVFVRVHESPLRDKTDNVVGLIGSLEDITEKLKAEEELEKYKNHLEDLVKEKTKELEKLNKKLDENLKVFVGREMTIINLEKEIKELKRKRSAK